MFSIHYMSRGYVGHEETHVYHSHQLQEPYYGIEIYGV